MKALFYPAFQELLVTRQPMPVLQKEEVLVKVLACGICGSELETFFQKNARRKPPLIMGHEFCGIVVKADASAVAGQIGTKVVSNSIVSCGTCARCVAGETNLCNDRQVFGMHRNGAFAEYVNVPQSCLYHLPNEVSPRAACLTEPLANAVHMVRRTAHLQLKTIVIFGAGSIGLMAQQAFQTLRDVSTIVVDLNDERLQMAKKLGALNTINPLRQNVQDGIMAITNGEAVDGVVDAAGTGVTNSQALQAVRPGGVLILIGLLENSQSMWSYDIILSEKQVLGSYAATRSDMQQALELIASGRVDVTSWVDYYPLEEGRTAFYNMHDTPHRRIKSVLLMPEA